MVAAHAAYNMTAMLYILHGSDSFSRGEALRALKRELDTDGSLESNTAEFEAGQTAPAEVMAACDTVPFLGGRRLVVVEGALSQGSSAGRRRSKRGPAESDAETAAQGPWWALVEHASRMPETTTLVLLDGGSVDEALLDALKPFATVKQFPLPGPKEVTGWVQARARGRGLEVDGRACSLIAELIGSDTGILASEIEKLLTFSAGARITEHDVKALVPDLRDREGYYLADAVADGKAAQATKLLHEMLKKGNTPPGPSSGDDREPLPSPGRGNGNDEGWCDRNTDRRQVEDERLRRREAAGAGIARIGRASALGAGPDRAVGPRRQGGPARRAALARAARAGPRIERLRRFEASAGLGCRGLFLIDRVVAGGEVTRFQLRKRRDGL